MSESKDGAKIVQAYRDHRPYLIDLAFRMLGDIGAAEDAVQDAFTRLLGAGIGEIDDERGWLIVVTSRLCLDRLRPAERVVFVLHDIFGMPFPAVAQTVGRTAPACRQLAKRARQKVAEGQPGARFDVASAEHRAVTEKFIAACANGDLDGLLAVLAPDAWGDIDLGPGGPVRGVEHGAAQVARNLLRFWGPATLVSQPLAGQPALLGFRDRGLAGVLVLGMRGDLIESVHVIADPAKLAALGLQLSGALGHAP